MTSGGARRTGPSRRAVLGATAATALVLPRGASAQTGPKKPKVPPGRDPGGVAVALIGAGVDYRASDIAGRLARDGEGLAIGWDVIDDDERPLESAPAPGRMVPPFAGSETARMVMREAPAARLVPVRVPADNPMSFGAALAFVSRTPVRVIGLLASAREGEPWRLFAEVARASPQLLIVVPAGAVGGSGAVPANAGLAGLANVLAVGASDGAGRLLGEPGPQAPIDVAAPVEPRSGDAGTSAALAIVATARTVALAARLVATAPDLDGARLKAAILRLARLPPEGSGSPTSPGWLPDIDKIRRLD